MRYNIYLGFDKKTEADINDLRFELYENFPHVPRLSKMPPHLSLLVFDNDDQNSVIEAFNKAAEYLLPFDVELNEIGSFCRRRGNVLFIKPDVPRNLKAYQEDLVLLSSSGSTVLSAFFGWKPHVTLVKGWKGKKFLEAEKYAMKKWKPVKGRLTFLGLINVRKPLDILASKNL
ncbi:MAG: 2'-5' RNA ligase family protein [Bdellovibrionales bacterium]